MRAAARRALCARGRARFAARPPSSAAASCVEVRGPAHALGQPGQRRRTGRPVHSRDPRDVLARELDARAQVRGRSARATRGGGSARQRRVGGQRREARVEIGEVGREGRAAARRSRRRGRPRCRRARARAARAPRSRARAAPRRARPAGAACARGSSIIASTRRRGGAAAPRAPPRPTTRGTSRNVRPWPVAGASTTIRS